MLQKLGFLPGFNKQVSELGAEGQWFDGDNVRFRYGTPEKIGGWDQLGEDKLTGVTRAIHHWDDNAGIKYAAIGTNNILYIYSGGVFYDIHPIRVTLTGCTFTSTGSSKTVTVTCTGTHGLSEDDIVMFDAVTGVTAVGSTFTDATFEDKKFMVTSIPTPTTFEITMATTESGTPLAGSGSASALCYYTVGPAQQVAGYGWGTGLWSGTSAGPATTTLASGINDTVTDIPLTSSAAFPSSGEIRIGSEDISFTANDTTTNILSGGAREVNGTTKASHSGGDTVTDISNYVAWGEASSADFVIDPGLWVLDNYGTKLIALIYNGKCFEWDAAAAGATSTRASLIANAPTASRHVLVSTPDRHLVFFGTETTVGDSTTQDDMFIRFSNQESIDATDSYTVTATNTAGTQRLAAGSVIMGAKRGRDAIYIWTDTSLFLMRFVGQPFTFSFEQAGTNCGLLGKNACVEVDGTAYWMSENGFFSYDGQLKSMPCLVEDFVYDRLNSTPKDLINCGLNNLFGEIQWFYCSSGSDVVDSVVTYSYVESKMHKRPIWTTGTLARTAWADSAVFDKPHATAYNASDNASYDVTGNTDGTSIYYEQETGTDQVDAGGSITAIASNILSGDFDITQRRSAQGQVIGMPDLRGDGEYIMKIRRFIPDFISQTGNTQISLITKNFPNDSTTTTSFTIDNTNDKVDVRVRARSIALKVANTASAQDWKLGTFRLDIQPDGRRG
tara:strand:- start:172 stop:2358 length:2187 start_codon:yes stop_codon:yes gene_type:complete